MLKFFRGLKKKPVRQKLRWADYRHFLFDICKFQSLNDTYANIARLQKYRFFVLHHEVYCDIDSLMDIARLEYDLGWKASYFLPESGLEEKHPSLKKLIALGHDVGLLYDMLGSLSERYQEKPKDLYAHAWAQFGDTLRKHYALNIRSIAPLPRADDIDNSLIWQRYNYRLYNIRCDCERDFREDNIIFFYLQNGEIQYLKRDLYGIYHPQKPGRKISNIEDLGKSLKQGLLVPRVVIKIRWD